MTRTLIRGALVLALLASTASFASPDGEMAPNDKELAQAYWRGQEALKKSDWNNALERFNKLEVELRRKEPQTADAAIYWQAYALLHARRNSEAKSTLERLQREFPQSRWKKDADLLMRQAQASTSAAPVVVDEDDDLAGVAVEGLLNAPPARALPILRKVLTSTHPLRVKKRALFVLSQIDEPSALDTLGEIAGNGSDPELRDEAIRMLGISGEKSALERLSTLFSASKDSALKSRIVQAWMIANRQDLILDAARNETDSSVRGEAIRLLGAMNATKELRELFASEKDVGNRQAIVQALGIAGDVSTLTSIATSERDAEVQGSAIQAIGIAGGKQGSEALVKLYSSAVTQQNRDAALHGLLIAGDTGAMRSLYQQAKTTEEKKSLLRMLTMLQGDETLDLIEAELDKGARKP